MRFSLQDIKRSIHRRSGNLALSLHFLRPGELLSEIGQLIAYHEQLLGQPQRRFSLEDARACIGDYRLAHCLIATLSNWYHWRQCEWTEIVQGLDGKPDLADLSTPVQLRLALYSYVNEQYQGFLDSRTRADALQEFAGIYHLNVPDLEYLLVLDSEEEALLVRDSPEPPGPQEVATLYNQWAFEATLFNASSVRFIIDCNAFDKTQNGFSPFATPTVGTGVGAVIKRLCYLARKLGVYYDLAYDASPAFLSLTLYGPQEVTGTPQQYGLRLARLCRMLLGYGASRGEQGRTKKSSKPSFSTAIVEAEATVHLSQRSYIFGMDANLLQLLPSENVGASLVGTRSDSPSSLFDSSIEQSFAEAFIALANSQGVDGWRLEREPEPLLLDSGIFIPDFAFTRAQRRIYMEILGFWTPAYRERKVQKLQQLQGRDDLLLAIPVEAKTAFASIASLFPIVFYDGQLSVTEVLSVLRNRYDDFAERLAQIDIAGARKRVRSEGLLSERVCYEVLHCYRRSEVQRAAERVVDADIRFLPGIGLYAVVWMEHLRSSFIEWMSDISALPLPGVLSEMRTRWPELAGCEDATIEALLGLWSEVQIRRNSIFDAVVEVVSEEGEEENIGAQSIAPEKATKKQVREKRIAFKKRATSETKQEDLWGS